MSGNRKYSAISAVIASICIAVYLSALVWAAVRIYTGIEQRRLTAEQEFFNLADIAAAAGASGFMEQAFIKTIEEALGASRTLEALIISGPNGEYAFEKVPEEAIYWVNSSPRFKNRFDFSRQPLFLPLRIQGLRNVNIQAISSALDYELLSNVLKRTLVIVLTALMAAFFTLLVETLRDGKRHRSQYTNLEYDSGLTLRPLDFNDSADSAPPPGLNDSSPPPVAAAEAGTGSIYPAAGSPQSLSVRTNVGLEDNTIERLNSELLQCASVGRELTLITADFKVMLDDDTYRRFAADTVRFFNRRELVFEKGNQGITVICPAVDLEKGFAFAEDFHRRIADKYSNDLSSNDFCMGLSSRSQRIVDAQRLMFEASEALERALLDPVSRIVAFKSDPEKYQAFINKKMGSPL